MPPAVPRPSLLTSPGFLWMAPLGTAEPANTVAGGVFTDTVPVAWLPLGATTEGTTFTYGSEVEGIEVAEFLDPVRFETVSRSGSLAFALASWTLSNYRRALNGGVAALTPTSGTAATALYTVEPPEPGAETRAMLLWESTDATVRLLCRQVLQGGEIESTFTKAPDIAAIPCTFNLEVPTAGKPFSLYGAGATRA
jgi:hypothetical protein